MHVVESCVRSFCVYQEIWMLTTGERLPCQAKDSNDADSCAVAIKKRADITGHIPRKISAACLLFIQRGGTITCIIIDSHNQYSLDLPQGGLQIPEFYSDDTDLMSKIKNLVKSAPILNLKNLCPNESLSFHPKQRMNFH